MDSATARRTATLTVGGADLFHAEEGSGDPVLIIGGAVDDADTFVPLSGALADRFRVITYDRRGIGRSAAGAPRPGYEDDPLAGHGADAAELLEHLGARPAHVVGVSIGAVIALHLAVAFPSAVADLIVHEPPLPALLRDPEREAALDRVAGVAAEAGGLAAGQEMSRATTGDDPREDAGNRAPAGDIAASLDTFFGGDFAAVRRADLDLSSLVGRSGTVCTGGEASQGRWDRRCAEALAASLGVPFRTVPGGHNPLAACPYASASAVGALLET